MNTSNRGIPNAALRLFNRELVGHRGCPVHTARSFSECILPTEKVLEVESPDAHIGRFTPDGRFLVCFSLQLQAVVLFGYLGPVPQPSQNPSDAVGFSRFFKERWKLNLCHGTELLNRDFCLTLRHGAFLLLASSTPVSRDGPAAAAAEGGGTPTAAAAAAAGEIGADVAGPNTQQEQQQQQADASQQGAAAGTAAVGVGAGGVRGLRAASGDWCEMTTFHVVDLQRCLKVDELRYPADYFELAGNSCASLHDNVLAITSLYSQTIHLLQVTAEGLLVHMQSIGRICQADDVLPVQLAAAAEQQWQLQRQQQQRKEQQERLEAASQQHVFLHMSQVQRQQQLGEAEQQQQQQQETGTGSAPDPQHVQQQLLQQVTHPNSLWGQAAAAAMGAAAVGNAGPAAAAAGRPASRTDSDDGDGDGGDDDDMSDDDEMERRERRRRVPATRQQQGQQQRALDPGTPGQEDMALLEHQQQLQLAAVNGPPARSTAAAASVAAAAAILDPQQQLIEGIQQRLLTYLYKALQEKQPNEVAPSMRDFQYNFGALSALVIFRARLLDRRHLLLKLAAPTTGPASGAELNPSRMHFFAVYDVVSTHFEGFWRASNARLLGALLAQPSQMLAAGRDGSPWDRCAAGALYPPGYPLGLGSSKRRQQQQADDSHRSDSTAGATGSGSRGRVSSARTTGRQRQPSPAADAGTQQNRGRVARAADGTTAGEQSFADGEAAAAAADDLVVDITPGSSGSSSSNNSKAARDRLKLLRQVVLLVLPGLQNLSSSPYLDPHLFMYSKHISPIIGLRNSPTEPLQFKRAKRYQGFEPGQPPSATALLNSGLSAHGQQTADEQDAVKPPPPCGSSGSREHHHNQQQQQQQQQGVVFELDPARPHSVVWGNEEVARRQLHLFHPSDPFVLTVVQTIAMPAAISIYYRT